MTADNNKKTPSTSFYLVLFIIIYITRSSINEKIITYSNSGIRCLTRNLQLIFFLDIRCAAHRTAHRTIARMCPEAMYWIII